MPLVTAVVVKALLGLVKVISPLVFSVKVLPIMAPLCVIAPPESAVRLTAPVVLMAATSKPVLPV